MHRLIMPMLCSALAWLGCGSDRDAPLGLDAALHPVDTSAGVLSADIGGVNMDFVWIEPGTFQMGSPIVERGMWRSGGDNDYDKDEIPQHQVVITQGFYLGKYEITQAQWEAVMRSNPVAEYGSSNAIGPNRPVHNISWDDAQQYIALLNEAADGVLYRLPTEAEWEYACRAATTTQWSCGASSWDDRLDDYAWYNEKGWHEFSLDDPGEVGAKLPNPWGLYDMHGNVFEWVQDWYGPYRSGPASDPTGPARGFYHVLRGGDIRSFDAELRSAARGKPLIGFDLPRCFGARLVRVK